MRCRLANLGLLRRSRGKLDEEDHGGVLMAEYRRRTEAQGVREEPSLAHAHVHVRVHRSRDAPRNAGRASRAARAACSAAAKREPRPPRVARTRRGLTASRCIGLGSANLRSCRLAPVVAETDDTARDRDCVDRVGASKSQLTLQVLIMSRLVCEYWTLLAYILLASILYNTSCRLGLRT